MKKLFILLFILCYSTLAQSQKEESAFPEIRISLSDNQFKKLVSSQGMKMDLKDAIMLINGDTVRVKEIHSRGNNSLNYKRKSLAVDLSEKVTIRQNGEKIKLKNFDLLNLVMDHNLWHNRWAFLSMSKLGLFPLYNSFCKLWINDVHQGIYLLVEKPSSFTDDVGSPFTIRRGPQHKVDKEYIKTDSKEEIKNYRQQYRLIYETIRVETGSGLFDRLAGIIDLPQYFSWLAFNYFVMNGDYADELFMYIHPESKLYAVIPWDYDDIIRPAPHEGWEQKNALAKNKLIFSSEESLDVAIVNDPFVYNEYLKSFKKVLDALDEDLVKSLAAKVLDELKVLSEDPEVSEATPFLGKEPFDLIEAEKDIKTTIDFIFSRRTLILSQIDE
ncbi:MAG: hypothetical protein HC811_01340 [Flammeovirgaceae bacterium]|nr:hypothetical protein [Flammeovirgaceae bacterium]